MADIIFISGGCRSGKSSYARKLAEALPGPRAFLATCPPDLDAEMAQRIAKHREERAGSEWTTLEESLRPHLPLSRPDGFRVYLLDCLSLWIGNLLFDAERLGSALGEADIKKSCADILAAAARNDYSLVIVSNEVGMGIVPDNAVSRQYRDMLGRANQIMAEAARMVFFMVSGIPLRIKG